MEQRCEFCGAGHAPHNPLQVTDGILHCVDAAECGDRLSEQMATEPVAMNERADLLPYVIGSDMDDHNPGGAR